LASFSSVSDHCAASEIEDKFVRSRRGDATAASASHHGVNNAEERREDSDSSNILQRELELLRRENALLQREFRWAAFKGIL